MCYMSPAFLTFLFLVAFIHVFHSTPTDQPYSLRCWLFPRRSPLISYPTDCAALQGEKLELHVLRFRKPCFFPQLFVAFFHFFKKTFPTPPPPTSALPSTAGDSNTIVPHQFITRHKPGDICLKPTFFGFFALSIHNWDSC